MDEKRKMLAHEPYDFPQSAALAADFDRALRLQHRLNCVCVPSLAPSADSEYGRTLRELCPNTAPSFFARAPFHCDYGLYIYGGEGCFVNHGCTFMDGGGITLGARCFIGPGVQVYTATHPLDAAERACGTEMALPVTIGDDCWIGGGAIVLPGVRIGDRCVVGAGSVVTHDVGDDTVVAGNPARVIRRLAPPSAK